MYLVYFECNAFKQDIGSYGNPRDATDARDIARVDIEAAFSDRGLSWPRDARIKILKTA